MQRVSLPFGAVERLLGPQGRRQWREEVAGAKGAEASLLGLGAACGAGAGGATGAGANGFGFMAIGGGVLSPR